MQTATVRATTVCAIVIALGGWLSIACSSDAESDPEGAGGKAGRAQGGQDDDLGPAGQHNDGGRAPGAPTNSAILVAGQTITPDDYFT